MRRRFLVLPAVAVIGAACAPPQPGTAAGPIAAGPTPVKASFDRTWEAARQLLQQRGVRLEGATRAPVRNEAGMLVGTLMGEFNPVPRYDLKVYTSDCGNDQVAIAHPVGDGDAHYAVTVQGDSLTSILNVSVAVTEAGFTCTTRREFEAGTQVEIKQLAESR